MASLGCSRIGVGYVLCAVILISTAGCLGDRSSTLNSGASLRGIPARQAEVGQAYTFTPVSASPSGQTLGYTIKSKPSWASFSIATGQLTGVPTSADVGTYPDIRISASNADMSVSLPAFTIDVVAETTGTTQKATLDTYGGVATVECANPNGTSYFGLTTLRNHKVLCDPAGHPYFGRGFYVFTLDTFGNDENGGNYGSYSGVKYGLSPPTIYTWDTAEVARMKAWGFNMIGPDSTVYATAWRGWYPSGTNPNKVPVIETIDSCYQSWANDSGYASTPVKDLLSTSSPNLTLGYYGESGLTDYEDPAWVTYTNGIVKAQLPTSANATDKSYFLGVIGCDNDYTHGFNAGPDFDTATKGNNDFRLSYLVALGSPVEWASTHQHQIYPDSTVYSKKAWYTQLTGKYASISALNTAWGSNYTTFGTSGTCYGSGFATWICPSAASATPVGTGNGSTLTFNATLNTTVSANSVGIFVGGTLVGGDGGDGHFSGTSGTIYGPNLSGTINYSTGALSIAFTSGKAPANGAAITAEYITNGWGVGTGVMDEDGRSGHQGWTGTNPFCLDGVGVPAVCTGGYASSGMVADLNTLDVTLATRYAQTYKNAITTQFPGALFLGLQEFGTDNAPPNRYVIQGMAPYTDIGVVSTSGPSGLSQSELDFIHTYGGDMALGLATYNAANFDSPFAWPGSSCMHSGTTVTCTLATPQRFSTRTQIMTSCADKSYNVVATYPSSSSGSSLAYTVSTMPINSSTTCNVAFNDGGTFTTQAARANAIGSLMAALPAASYSADGVHPYVLTLWWQWSDKQNELLDWGVVDTRDNAFNGAETTTAAAACSAPLQVYSCGGELRSGWGSDDGITPLIKANNAIDAALAAIH